MLDVYITIVRLLVAGKKDHAIARELGVSVTSVRRRVTEAADLLKVEGRVALGAAAAKAGWLRSMD